MGADVIPLAIQLSGVEERVENPQKRHPGDDFGVEGDSNDLCVTCLLPAYLLVSGIVYMATAVTGDYLVNTLEA